MTDKVIRHILQYVIRMLPTPPIALDTQKAFNKPLSSRI